MGSEKLTKLEREVWSAYAAALIGIKQPRRIYLGGGIWWQPSEAYLRHLDRLALKSGEQQ